MPKSAVRSLVPEVVDACVSGRWEARIGIPGSKHIYLGLHDDEDGAARAYDSALVKASSIQIIGKRETSYNRDIPGLPSSGNDRTGMLCCRMTAGEAEGNSGCHQLFAV